MRELLFKNFISRNRKRAELFLAEHLEKRGVVRDIEKKIVYVIKYIQKCEKPSDLEYCLKENKKKDHPPQVFIVKRYKKKKQIKQIFYKITGDKAVIIGCYVIIYKMTQHIKKTVFVKKKALPAT